MSGRPNAADAEKLLAAVRARHRAVQQIAHFTQVIGDAKAELVKAEQALAASSREAIQLLEIMDCTGAGNFGWEARILVLLAELERQARAGSGGGT